MEPWKVPRRETIVKERKVQMERERNDDKKRGTSNANRKLETELPVEHAWTSFGQYCDQPALGQLQPPLLTPISGIVDTPLTRCPWQVKTLHRETKRWRLSFVGIKLETQSDRSFFVQLPATERKSTVSGDVDARLQWDAGGCIYTFWQMYEGRSETKEALYFVWIF